MVQKCKCAFCNVRYNLLSSKWSNCVEMTDRFAMNSDMDLSYIIFTIFKKNPSTPNGNLSNNLDIKWWNVF